MSPTIPRQAHGRDGDALTLALSCACCLAQLTRLYLPVIMTPLIMYLFKHRHALQKGPNSISWWNDVLPALADQFGLDRLFAKLWDLPGGLEEYHRRGSAVHVLHRIMRTTLIVHAADDPICPVGAMPLDAMARNPHLITAITRHGGHMGYTAGCASAPLRTPRTQCDIASHECCRDTWHASHQYAPLCVWNGWRRCPQPLTTRTYMDRPPVGALPPCVEWH